MPGQKVTALFQRFADIILDALFPHRCYGCGQAKTLLCGDCFKRLPRRSPVLTTSDSLTKKKALDTLISPLYFATPLVSSMIHDFKFQGIQSLAPALTQFLSDAIEHSPLALPHIITEVPLHPTRERERGYNQTLLLAEHLTLSLNHPVPITTQHTLLKRIKRTPPQSKQKERQARLVALDHAFALADPDTPLQGKIIWLIDDVATTHTTLEKCAEILKAAGAKEVHGIVVAR